MTALGKLRGHPIYWDPDAEIWRFCDTDEPTVDTWQNRPCAVCGLYGNSATGDVDPCLGVLSGVTNACCGHGDPDVAYIVFQGGLVIRGFEVDQLHHRHMSDEEQRLILEHNERLRTFREAPKLGESNE